MQYPTKLLAGSPIDEGDRNQNIELAGFNTVRAQCIIVNRSDWKKAQAKVAALLGKSTSKVILESGNKHLMKGTSL